MRSHRIYKKAPAKHAFGQQADTERSDLQVRSIVEKRERLGAVRMGDIICGACIGQTCIAKK